MTEWVKNKEKRAPRRRVSGAKEKVVNPNSKFTFAYSRTSSLLLSTELLPKREKLTQKNNEITD